MTHTIESLIRDLQSWIGEDKITKDTPVVIRQGIGWDGFSNFDVEVAPVIIRKDMQDDYEEAREAIRSGKEEGITVIALKRHHYDSEAMWQFFPEDDL